MSSSSLATVTRGRHESGNLIAQVLGQKDQRSEIQRTEHESAGRGSSSERLPRPVHLVRPEAAMALETSVTCARGLGFLTKRVT